MNNVTYLPPPPPPEESSEYAYQNQSWSEFSFYVGVASTIVFPQIVFWSCFGLGVTSILAGCAIAGAVTGVGIRERFPFSIPSCVPPTIARATTNIGLKLAA